MRAVRISAGLLVMLCAARQAAPATAAYQAAVTADNPALYYRFDEPTGDIVNHGSLGAAYNGVVSGTAVRSVASTGGDTALGFNSADDRVASLGIAPAGFTGNPTFTAEAVFRVNDFATLWAPLLHWGAGASGKEAYFGFQNNNEDKLYAGFYNAGLRTVNRIPQDTWLHVVWTRQGGADSSLGSRLFINGTAVPLEIDTDLIFDTLVPDVTATAFHINHASDFTRFFIGDIDELSLYSRALTAEQVLEHYQAFALGARLGDTDYDGDIDDFDLINAIVGYTGSLPAYTGNQSVPTGDTDLDLDTDDFDLINMIVNYTGSLNPPASVVPEPAALACLAGAGLIYFGHRGRR